MKIYSYSSTLWIGVILLMSNTVIICQSEESSKSEENLRALSRSKASVWVDTNKGSVFSSSLGTSHLEKSANGGPPTGQGSNMLLTLLFQPAQSQPMSIAPVVHTPANDLQLRPVMLLLQQQQDISERVLEKQEKLEKMNVHLQQQVKHQQQLIVDLLEQIKLFLEAIGDTPSAPSTAGSSSFKKQPIVGDDLHQTSANSQANAVVSVPRRRGSSESDRSESGASGRPLGKKSKKVPPIVVSSQSDTVEYVKFNATDGSADHMGESKTTDKSTTQA